MGFSRTQMQFEGYPRATYVYRRKTRYRYVIDTVAYYRAITTLLRSIYTIGSLVQAARSDNRSPVQ